MFADKSRLVGLILHTLFLLLPGVSGEIPDYDEIRSILNNGSLNISYNLLKTYFDKTTGIESDKIALPRLFPLCVQTKTLESFSDLQNFAPIWKEMEKQDDCESRPLRFYEYNATLHSMRHNKDWIESITLSRINTPEVDVRNMRQWMHITVKAKKPLQALYMQPVVGSIGLPSGEFSLEFPCSDLTGADTSDKDSMVFHCDYRSRAELNHPVAFFGGYKGSKTMQEFHVHYKWTDISCLETPFLQFIVIAVKDVKAGSPDGPKLGIDFQPLLSPVWTNIEFDSKDGAITPYYIDWKDDMTCQKTSADPKWSKSTKLYHDTYFAPLKWKESEVDRILVNEELDECVTATEKLNDRDDDHRECAPGPFECPVELSLKTISDTQGFEKIVKRRQTEFDEVKAMSDCSPCIFPKKEEVMKVTCDPGVRYLPPPSSYNFRRADESQRDSSDPRILRDMDPYLYLDYSEYLNSAIDARYHGALAILVNVVISPFAIFMARYYRGVPCGQMEKNDFWILLHTIMHLFGLLLYWAAVGLVPSGDEGVIIYGQHCYELAARRRDDTREYDPDWSQEKFEEWLDGCTYDKRKSSHTGIGIFSFVIHNLNVFFSFFRSRTDYIRNIQVIIHSHLGYLDMIMAVITVFTAVENSHCTEILGYCLFLAIFSSVIFLIGAYVTRSEDRQIGVDPPRYKWPILEPIRLSETGPLYEEKMALLGIYGGILVFIRILNVVAVTRVGTSETTILASNETEKKLYGVFKTRSVPDFYVPDFGGNEEGM